MKVYYQSAVEKAELKQGCIFYAVPAEAWISLQYEKHDGNCEMYVNGVLQSADGAAVSETADITVWNNGEKHSYTVRPVARGLSGEYAQAYSQFQFEYGEKTVNELDGIQAGQLRLYAVDQSADVEDKTEIFHKIESAFPNFKAVCDKPKSHLRSVNEIRPIETVKRIGYESIPYLAAHSEDWLARTAGGLKPARLFSRAEDDEYQIYENRFVKTLIDLIISFLRKEEKSLKDHYEQLHGIINSSVQTGSFGFDVGFQKAVAELIATDDRGEEYRSEKMELAQKLQEQAHVLLRKYRSLRNSRLYRYLNKAKPVSNPLNETNILLMDRNYSVLFKLWKNIHETLKPRSMEKESEMDVSSARKGYIQYCKTLYGYAAHVLNFTVVEDGLYRRMEDCLELSLTEKDGIITAILRDRKKRSLEIEDGLNVPISPGEECGKFGFNGKTLVWENDVTDDEIEKFCTKFKTRESRGKKQAEEKKRYQTLKEAILNRQREYSAPKCRKTLLIPALVELETGTRVPFHDRALQCADRLAEQYGADAVIVALPVCNENEQQLTTYAKMLQEHTLFLPLTMYDINSFRRLQNVLMRSILAMNDTLCPCCGGEMRRLGDRLICDSCDQLMITRTTCPNPECRHDYVYLSYDVRDDIVLSMLEVDESNFYQTDSLFQYRDIVPMEVSEDGVRPVCPYCGN